MELTDSQLIYFVNNRLKLPKGEVAPFSGTAWRLS